MAHSTPQENPDGAASHDTGNERDAHCSDHVIRDTTPTHSSITAREQSGQSPSHSSYKDYETATVDPLLDRFLLSLNAREIAGTRGCRTFVLQPEAYAKTSKSLLESDPEVWGYVSDKLR